MTKGQLITLLSLFSIIAAVVCLLIPGAAAPTLIGIIAGGFNAAIMIQMHPELFRLAHPSEPAPIMPSRDEIIEDVLPQMVIDILELTEYALTAYGKMPEVSERRGKAYLGVTVMMGKRPNLIILSKLNGGIEVMPAVLDALEAQNEDQYQQISNGQYQAPGKRITGTRHRAG